MKKLTLLVFALFCANVLSANIPAGTKLYLEPSSEWRIADARFAVYFFGSSGDAWVSMTPTLGTNFYEVVTPAGDWSNLIFLRMDPDDPRNQWGNPPVWTQTGDLTFDGTNNLYSIIGWGGGNSGTWSQFVPSTEPSVSLIVPTSVILGEAITLSANSANVDNPTIAFLVRTPESQNFVEITSPYTPTTVGTYTFQAILSQGISHVVLATDEREVEVRNRIPVGTVLYLNPTEIWNVDGARFVAYFFGVGDTWVDMTAVAETDYYEVTTPDGVWSNVIFVRMDGSALANVWTNRWNQTADLEYDGTNNLYTITGVPPYEGGNNPGVWSVANLAPSVTLHVPSVVYLGSSITLSATARQIENPVFAFAVRTPGSTNFIPVTSPYTPATVGVYTFRVYASHENIDVVLATDEKEVIVREFTIGNGITIGVRKPSDWENIAIHYWSGASSGWVIPTFYNDFYVHTFEDADEVNIIFVNSDGTGFPHHANDSIRLGWQTINIERIEESMCFEILDATHVDGDVDWGKRRIRSLADCPFDDDPSVNIVDVAESRVIFYVANGVLNVNFEGLAQIELFTINGQLIKSQQVQSHFSTHLHRGMYLLRVNGEVHKVMVK